MSKESYARGFCKAAQMFGIDPVALATYFAGAKDAGIGRYGDNSIKDPTSYVGRLFARLPEKPYRIKTPSVSHFLSMSDEKEDPVSLEGLASQRRCNARANASTFYPVNSVPYKRVYDNLRNAGRENYESYLETGDTKERTEPNLQGLEKLKLTPEQKKRLLQMQNTMVSKGVPRTGNIA